MGSGMGKVIIAGWLRAAKNGWRKKLTYLSMSLSGEASRPGPFSSRCWTSARLPDSHG